MKVYLDNASTTRIDKKVLKKMLPYLKEKYGNASSMHNYGSEAKKALEKSRNIISKRINADPSEIYFTSGGTEANNWALKGLFFENKPLGKNHIITTKIEHSSIMKTCEWLKSQGAEITFLKVDKEGFVDIQELEKSIKKETFLVSIIHGNNEVGTIQNLEKIGKICKEKNVKFHSDACQSFTKVEIDVKKMNLDLLTLNSHKIHGPKGVGALYVKKGTKINPLLNGGEQEKGFRSGTENIAGIVGFSEAVKNTKKKDVRKMEKMRDNLIEKILKEIPNTSLNGPKKERLPNNINISFNNVEGEAIGGYLENEGIAVSTGSACMSNTLETSHVLKALGLPPLRANSSIRISISKYTTKKEINYFINKLSKVIKNLRKLSPLVEEE